MSDCIEWSGRVDKDGYGLVGNRRVGRVILGLETGDPRCALHSCDNPPCINPDHLFVGTKRDNSVDMARKGRAHMTKITPAQARAIRLAVSQGTVQRRLAETYSVHATTINRIVRGRTRTGEEVMP